MKNGSALGPEWLYEAGIGEDRAVLVEDGAILEAHIELHDAQTRVGTIAPARLIDKALVRLEDGTESQLTRPAGVPQGAALTVRIVREPISEPGGRLKPARALPTDEPPHPGPDLRARLTGAPVRPVPSHGPDLFEQAGWSELLEEARIGDILFPGGALRMWPTPAMTLFDVDGSGSLDALAIAAAGAVGAAVRRHGIGGSIGIDFPTLAGKAARQAVAEAVDAACPQPFERTAVNGFGFLQIVRPRPRMSLPEQLRADPVGAQARATLRRLEREPPDTPRCHRLPTPVLTRLQSRPDWLAELARRTGVTHQLDPA